MPEVPTKIEIPAGARDAWGKLLISDAIKLKVDPAWVKSEQEARENMAKHTQGVGKEPGPALKATETFILSAAGYVELESGKMQDAADLANRHQRMATLALLLNSILIDTLHRAKVGDGPVKASSDYLHGEVGRALFPVLYDLGIMPKPQQDEVSQPKE